MAPLLLLTSIQTGRVKVYPPAAPGELEWTSGIAKQAVAGPVWLGVEGLAGDEQSDHRHHGGLYQAVNVYPAEHYAFWNVQPGMEAMAAGAFGENFTTQGMTEETVCIGDVYQVGEARVSISNPRQPCYKLNRLWNVPALDARAEELGLVGWYFKVDREGNVEAGQPFTLVDRLYPQWTIARVYALRRRPDDQEALRALVECPGLSPNWRETLKRRLSG